MNPLATITGPIPPILLYNDECAICRRLGAWVQASALGASGQPSLIARPIGEDPQALRALNPQLDIWDAYAHIHVLMPDGAMKIDGEAVAEVLRDLPNTRWFAWSFSIGIFGFRPCQAVLNVCYLILADVRPLLGCESCGSPSFWVRPFVTMIAWVKRRFTRAPPPGPTHHSTSFTPGTAPAATPPTH
jgi:predicted DCC family thiol-disulfide oxidoreductase YuxK